MNEFRIFYESLNQPSFAPAPEVFGLAWGIIYPLIAITGLIIFIQAIRNHIPVWLTGLFIVNIFLNLLFTPLELSYGLLVGTVVILLVLSTLIILEWKLWSQSKSAFWLLVPYLLWGSFATVLQIDLLIRNFHTVL